jgi:hypothetical protein
MCNVPSVTDFLALVSLARPDLSPNFSAISLQITLSYSFGAPTCHQNAKLPSPRSPRG